MRSLRSHCPSQNTVSKVQAAQHPLLKRKMILPFCNRSNLFGFEQWDAPVLENEDLYKRKAGEEITDQLYCFEVRRGGWHY